MRERKNKPYLIFPISNSPLVYTLRASYESRLRDWHHRPLCYRDSIYEREISTTLKTLQTHLASTKQFKIETPLPEDPQTYIVKYAGEKDLNIYETEDYDRNYNKGAAAQSLLVKMLALDRITQNPLEESNNLICGAAIADPWPFFYKLAWPQDICSALEHRAGGMTEGEWIEIDFSKDPVWLEEQYSIDDLLKIIGDCPQLLRRSIFREFFIKFLENTQTKSTEEQANVKKLLNDCLIPKKNKFDNSLKQSLARELMLKLVSEINSRCSKALERPIVGHIIKKGEGKILEQEQHNGLMTWAINNSESRIAVLSKHDLSKLLFNPPQYVNTLLKAVSV